MILKRHVRRTAVAIREEQEQGDLLHKVRRVCRLACVLLRILFIALVSVWLLQLLLSLSSFMFPHAFKWLNDFEISIPLDFLVLGFLPAAFIGIATLILQDISRGETPFSEKQSKRIRLIAYLMFARVVLESLLLVVITALYPDGLIFLSYYASESSTPVIYLDFGALISAIVCYCISLAFEYGALLQRDSDDFV
jgi:hypothetical protein